MYRVGIDIGGTKIALGIFKDAQPLCDARLEVSALGNPVADIRAALESLCKSGGVDYDDLSFVGVGIPGTVSEDGRKILKAPNIGVLSADFADELEATLDLPVRMVQDSRAAAWGEYVAGAGKNAKTLLCITLGTGIGTGLVMNGKIYDGTLGSAGELGHVPVRENGRPCGCGKCGCVEKYAAGGGLDLTARELFGEGKTAYHLFDEAKNGNQKAKDAIGEAVRLLGGVVVSALNLLSPDMLLFSGGLCEQEELYLSPLMDYVRDHAYAADGKLPEIKKATLGEKAPMYGAALLPFEGKSKKAADGSKRPLLAASLMCANVLNLEKALSEMQEAGIDYVHCDIMDNHFVPNLMLPPEWLNRVRTATDLPFDYHLMTERPETVIERLDIREGDLVSIHAESTVHLDRVLSLAEDKGAKIAVAINPATPIETLSEILPRLDMVLLMTVNPGFAGQKLAPGAFDKIARMRKMLHDRGFDHILLQVDGNCSFENIPKMYEAGADVFVVGSSSVFHKDMTIADATEKVLDSCK